MAALVRMMLLAPLIRSQAIFGLVSPPHQIYYSTIPENRQSLDLLLCCNSTSRSSASLGPVELSTLTKWYQALHCGSDMEAPPSLELVFASPMCLLRVISSTWPY